MHRISLRRVPGKRFRCRYPVDRGILHPAKFSGEINGQTMTLTVMLTDTNRLLGPVTLIYGNEPKMGPCPICRVPKSRIEQLNQQRRASSTP
ncbi:MAG: hypothetical protein ACJ8AK_15885 [Gemmatimonadaceae bacterium]